MPTTGSFLFSFFTANIVNLVFTLIAVAVIVLSIRRDTRVRYLPALFSGLLANAVFHPALMLFIAFVPSAQTAIADSFLYAPMGIISAPLFKDVPIMAKFSVFVVYALTNGLLIGLFSSLYLLVGRGKQSKGSPRIVLQ